LKNTHGVKSAASPAAYDTIKTYFDDSGTGPSDYDLIVTGDLSAVGKQIVIESFEKDGIDMRPCYNDCGVMIFDPESQDVHAGGSGCGCSASVLCGYILNGMKEGRWNNVLFAATGALMSPISIQQGESIPAVCHLIAIHNKL